MRRSPRCQPRLPRRRALFVAVGLGMLGMGLGSAIALPADDSPGPPPSDYCTTQPKTKPPVTHRQPAASLTSSARHVVLTAGHATTVRLGMVQPAQELDTFFLEDNGTKSEFTHCAFQGALLWALPQLATKRNLQVGLGNFGDYAAYDQADSEGGFTFAPSTGGQKVYLLDSPIRRPDATFFADVRNLGNAWNYGWNATTGDQADLEAVYQAVTGAGRIIAPAFPDNIPAGGSADFHSDAYRVVVLLAAHWFHTAARNPGYPGASSASVVDTLRAHDVHVAGVWMDNSRNKENNGAEQYDGLADIRSLVEGGGTRTGSPLQCGTDHPTDPAGGLPLCVFLSASDDPGVSARVKNAPGQFGPILRNLVLSLSNPQRISVEVLHGSNVVAGVVGGQRAGVDILRSHSLQASVTVKCPVKLAGHAVPVELGEFIAGQLRATTSFSVTCRRIPPVVHAGREGVVFGAADVPPAAAGEPPVPQMQPQPQAQTQPQPQPQPQPQQVPQGAVAAGFGEEFQMSPEFARVPGGSSNGDATWFGVLAMSALAGAAVRWRSRTQVSHI